MILMKRKPPVAGCKPGVFVQLDETGNITVPTNAVDKGSYGSCGAQVAGVTLTPNTF